MALTRGFTQNSGTTPLDTRLMFMALLKRNTDGSPRLGMLYGPTSPVTGTTSMNVTLADNTAFVLSRGTTDGVTIISNVGGTVSVTLDSAPSANARIDVVWLKQNDGGTGGQGDADSLPTFGKTSGTAAASPAVPAIPTGALPLARIYVPANVASTTDSGVSITNVVGTPALVGTTSDSGWLALPGLSTAFQQQNNPAYRLIGNMVVFRGQLNRSAGINAGVGLFTMPTGALPAQLTYFQAQTSFSTQVRLSVSKNTPGRVEVDATGGNPTYIILDNLSYIADQ